MALTVSNVTTANSTSSGATLDLTGVTAAIGDWLVLAAAADNSGASGVSATSATITDAAGNTWTRQSVTNRTNAGAADDGTTLSVWTCPVTATLTGATITINFSPNVTSKAAALKKVVASAGRHVRLDSVGAGVSGSGTAYTSGNVSVPVDYTIFGFTAIEHNAAATGDSDTTNGSWSTAQTAVANTGTSNTSQSVTSQHKTATATGNQSYDSSSGATRDYALNYIILFEAIQASLAATEAADVAAFTAKAYHSVQLAAVEAPDVAAFTASTYHSVHFAPTEPADVAAFEAATYHSALLAAAEAADTADFAAAVYHSTQLAATETADVADFTASTFPSAHFAITEAPDVAAFNVDLVIRTLTLAATERPDRAAFTISPFWPAYLPSPTLQGYSFTPASSVERRPMEIGAPRVYRRTRKPVIEVAVAWQLDDYQQALLDGFQTSTLQQGGQWFGIELAFPSGLATAVARFKDKVAMKARGGPRWQTTATLELLTRPMMTDADLTALLDDAGDPPAWPEDLLPYPVLDTWELTPKPATIRTDDLPGLPQQRQRSRNSTTEVPATWELTATEAAIFEAFFHHRGKDGAAWFDFPVVQAIGTDTTKVRFLGDIDWTPRGGGGRWAVSAPLEIRERAVLSAPEVTEQIAEGPPDA